MKYSLILSLIMTSLSASQPPWKGVLVKSPGLRDIHDPTSYLDADPLRGELVISYYDYLRLRIMQSLSGSGDKRDLRVHGSKRRARRCERTQDPEVLFPSSPRYVESDMSDEEQPTTITPKKPKSTGE